MRDILTFILIKIIVLKGYFDLWRMHRNAHNARKKNDRLLLKIIKQNQDTVYGRKYDFRNIRTVEDYRNKVPFSTYEDYKEYIDRMIMNGEQDLITTHHIVDYARTSGSTGEFKYIPVSRAEVKVHTAYTLTVMMALADKWSREKNGHPLKPGRGIFTMPDAGFKLPNGKPCSNIAQVSAERLGFIFPYLIVLPFPKLFSYREIDLNYLYLRLGLEDPNLAFIFSIFFSSVHDLLMYLKENWKTLTDDIEKGTISDLARADVQVKERLLKYLKPNPQRAAELRQEMDKGFDETIVSRIWPNMSVIYGIHNGVFEPFKKSVRKLTKDIPYDNSIYGSSEGLIAASDEFNTDQRLLLSDSLYYEFIPLDDENKIFSLDELEKGKEYEIVITNQAGLYRYRIKDVIKVENYLYDCPYISFSYRKGSLLSVIGEKTTEEHLKGVIETIGEKADLEDIRWTITIDIDSRPPRYLLLLENEEGKDLCGYSQIADETLKRLNPKYASAEDHLFLKQMKIVNQLPGTHEAWKERMLKKGTALSQIKPVTLLDNDEKKDFFLSRIQTDNSIYEALFQSITIQLENLK